MAFVTDPDNLDRWQVLVAPEDETISLRGLGTSRIAATTDGQSGVAAATNFDSATAGFVANSVAAGDILTVFSDPASDLGIIGHYEIQSVTSATRVVLDRAITVSTAADLDFRVDQPVAALGGVGEDLIDGATKQAIYSFLKEEWRTKSGPAGGADLIQFTFPIESITREQFEIGGPTHSNWTYDEGFIAVQAVNLGRATTRELIKTAGWQEQSVAGKVLKDYAGIISLGTLDADAQAYYQQHDDDTTPLNFVLQGPVNQAINTYDLVALADAGTGYDFDADQTTVTRNDSGDWAADGFEVGGLVTIIAAETPANNGTFRLLTVGSGANGSITCETEDGSSQTPFTLDVVDNSVEFAINKRKFLVLRARKKARTYPESNLADAGVDGTATGTGIETIVTRFGLAHAADPAILLDDGQIAGDPAAAQAPFTTVETHATDTDGETDSVGGSNGDGTFAFSSATVTPAFNDGVLRVGDSLEITSGSAVQGFYEILSIDSATVITCYEEPTVGAIAAENTLSFTTRTRVRDSGTATATLTDVDSLTGTLDDVGATFTTDEGLGDRTVAIGDMVIITAGDASAIGIYKVDSITDADTLVLNTSDQPIVGGPHANQTYVVLRAGMYLQRFESLATQVVSSGGRTFTWADDNPDTITLSSGDLTAETIPYTDGMAVTVVSPLNSGQFIVDTAAATVLTLIAEEALVAEGPLSSGAETLDGDTGIVRTLNSVDYPFHWRLFGNGGSLAQCFQYVQRQLRRGEVSRGGAAGETSDIDQGNGVERGDITDLLMTFVSPNGTGLDMFIDDLLSTDFNNSTFQDLSGDNRNFAFIAGVTISLNQNLLDDGDGGPTSSNKIVVFFTSVPSGDFGTNAAIIVDDSLGADMSFTDQAATPINTTFDYTNNAQGGRTPDNPAAITIVAIGLEDAQYVQVTGTIVEANENVFTLVAALERNYSNP